MDCVLVCAPPRVSASSTGLRLEVTSFRDFESTEANFVASRARAGHSCRLCIRETVRDALVGHEICKYQTQRAYHYRDENSLEISICQILRGIRK